MLVMDGPASGCADGTRQAVVRPDADAPVSDMMTLPELIRWRNRLYRKDGPVISRLGLTRLVLTARRASCRR